MPNQMRAAMMNAAEGMESPKLGIGGLQPSTSIAAAGSQREKPSPITDERTSSCSKMDLGELS